jgi:hypothetical protein
MNVVLRLNVVLRPGGAAVRGRAKGLTRNSIMRSLGLLVAITVGALGPTMAAPAALDPASFTTVASFAVDDSQFSLKSAVATIEPRPGAPGYSWVRIYFYPFAFAAEDIATANLGDLRPIEAKRTRLSANTPDYNRSNAVIQLNIDKEFKVWQIDMSVPGHGCTIAPFEPDVKAALQTYQFDGHRLQLQSRGGFMCDMKFMGLADKKFGWDIDLDLPVFEKAKAQK